jgi:hypothetical protein
MNPRTRALLLSAGVIVAGLIIAWVGIAWAQNSRITADKVTQYARTTDLAGLSGTTREEALRRLEEMINRLPPGERRQWRRDGAWKKWFDDMSESEKGRFIDATMPSGFKQWLSTFDGLPEDSRKKFIDYLSGPLRDTHQLVTDREPGETNVSMYGTNVPPQLSAELEQRARTIGLKTYYTESSAETKAELAPFLEQLQRQMQQGGSATTAGATP